MEKLRSVEGNRGTTGKMQHPGRTPREERVAGVLGVDGKAGWMPSHSTKSIEECGEKGKAEAKKMARNT